MNIDLSHNLEQLAKKLRELFSLPSKRESFDKFRQIEFKELSNKISETFPYITINDENTIDSYMVKRNGYNEEGDIFEIYIAKETSNEQKLNILMHEFAHIFFHKKIIQYDIPIGKNQGNWEQELEADYFARAFLLPEELFIKALSIFSRNDGTVDLERFSSFFKVQQRLIVERGRDLKIW